jgi:hypothetical protein
MAYANANYSDVLATTIESRSGIVADNVTKNNALLTRLREKGKMKPFSGGSTILQELSFQANSTAMYYSGAETLNISPADVISAAQLRKVLGDKLEPSTTLQDPTTTKPKG